MSVRVGASGWSYPSWKPGFYPAGTAPADFLRFYAERFWTVELNVTGYRLPAQEQFERWAAQAPDGFEFAVKLPGHRLATVETFVERVRALGDRLGPIRVVVPNVRDDGLLAFLLGSLDPSLRLAFDLRHPSWDGVDVPVRVGELQAEAPFAYLRLREPPYSRDDLATVAAQVRGHGRPVYVYFRHEDEPSAPRYASTLLEMLGS